jgi:spermidine synthase
VATLPKAALFIYLSSFRHVQVGTMVLDDRWLTEICEDSGCAFSMKLGTLLHDEQTAYQRIRIYETESFGTAMLIDGAVMLTDRDNFIYHEMMSHPALFTHPRPEHVLIIGGGDCGTLREVIKHETVRRVVQVEIDERVTRLAEQYFPELCESNENPRAELHFSDGIRWVAETPAGQYDLILVDSTDPVGPATGLFSETFYRDCLRTLKPGGIFAQQSESPLFHTKFIKSMHDGMRHAGFLDVRLLHFPQCSYPSGWWSATLAGKDRVLSGFRESAAADKTFPTRYYNAAVHRAAMAAPEFLCQALVSS